MDTNKNKQDIIDLSDFFITRSQANDFTVRLNAIVGQMYTANYNFEKAINAQFGIQKADIFLKILRDHGLQNATLREVQDFLKKIQDIVKDLSVVSLTIAFEPSEDMLKSLVQWFTLNVHKQVVFDIQVDHHIIAGVKINYNGKFKDYSVGPLFDTLVQNMLHPQTSQQTQQTSLHQNQQLITIGR